MVLPSPARLFSLSLLIYLRLCWVFVAALGLSLVAVSESCSLVAACGCLIVVVSLVAEHGLQSPWLPGSSAQAQ